MVNFILVDDDYVSNLIGKKIITKVFPHADVQTFLEPAEALIYIQSAYSGGEANDAILLLDINMPVLSGWDFLDAFEKFDNRIKERVKIYMLSSSVAPHDKDRAAANKNVSGYLEKPLSKEVILAILQKNINSAA
jgi:CheY-like chemotaxis protein